MRTSHPLLRTAAVAAALGLGVTACTSDGGQPAVSGRVGPQGVRSAVPVALESGRSCDAVLEDFQAYAPLVVEDAWFGGGFAMPSTAVMEDGAADTAASAPQPSPDEATRGASNADSSDTNVQEEGIDEPDLVETDGDYVYFVDRDALVILDGATADVVSRTPLGQYGAQLLLQGDRLLAITNNGYVGGPMIGGGVAIPDVAVDRAVEGDGVDAGTEGGQAEPMPVEPPQFTAGTVIQLLDVSDRTAPTILQTAEIEGTHVATRVVDGVARVVVASYPQPQPLMDVTFSNTADVAQNIEAGVSATTIEDWLPAYRTTSAGATSTEGTLVECEDVFVPEVNAGLGETSVLRVDFEDGFDPADTTTVVAEAGSVYASASTLYVAANQYVPAGDRQSVRPGDFATALHAFDLGGDGAATHLAAGQIPGHVLNQYSMSEYDGHLRVASTEGTPWDEADPSQSGVRVLHVEGGQLVEDGSVTGLGVTEQIQSVRFMGPVGYVVTFRQTDPLYVIDLSVPTAPEAVGELKIPGFSSYLHPVGEGRLVGVGRDADLEGRDQGFLVSLFDVSDPTNPQQLQTYTERDAWSMAGNDPKAFLWWEPESAVVIPVERYGPVRSTEPGRPVDPDGPVDEPSDELAADELAAEQASPVPDVQERSGITVLDVADDGITERATVTAEGRYPMRALVVQGRLWSLFDGGVVVSDFANPAQGTYHGYR